MLGSSTSQCDPLCDVLLHRLPQCVPPTTYLRHHHSQSLLRPVYTISLLATLNARERLRLQIELFGQASLPRITRTSNSVSRRSMRAVIDAMACPSQYPTSMLVTHKDRVVPSAVPFKGDRRRHPARHASDLRRALRGRHAGSAPPRALPLPVAVSDGALQPIDILPERRLAAEAGRLLWHLKLF